VQNFPNDRADGGPKQGAQQQPEQKAPRRAKPGPCGLADDTAPALGLWPQRDYLSHARRMGGGQSFEAWGGLFRLGHCNLGVCAARSGAIDF